MSRFLIISFIALTLTIGAAGAFAPAAHAVTDNPCQPGFSPNPDPTGSTCIPSPAPSSNLTPGADEQIPTTNIPFISDILGNVMVAIMTLFAWILGVAAITLDDAVYYTVVTMGSYVSHLTAVGVTWRILRDIGNILLIFGFLAVGITTILNVNWYGSGKKMLPMLLLAAVFLNFSLFISEAVIDTGNLFATEFYTQINGGQPPHATGFSLDAIGSEGISQKILQNLGLATIYSGALTGNTLSQAGSPVLIGFMSIILFMVAAFVMFSLAFVLIARFIMLIFVIILAPLGFVGAMVPRLEKIASWWWNTLISQTITAPVLLLLLYIALAIITDAQFLTGFIQGCPPDSIAKCTDNQWTGFIANSNVGGFAGIMLSFLVAMGLLAYVVIASKQLSAWGNGMATGLASKLIFRAPAMITGFTARRTLGAGSHALSHRIGKTPFGRDTPYGRALVGGLGSMAKQTYDVRGIPLVKSAAGNIQKHTGLDFGPATKTNYADMEKKAIEARVKYAETLENTKEEEERMTLLESRKKQQQVVHTTEVRNLEAEHRIEGQPHEDEIRAQRAKVAELRAKADLTKLDADKKELADAELTLSNQTKERDELRAKQQNVRRQLDALQKETLTNIENEVQEIKRAPQETYAENLKKSGFVEGIVFGPGVEKAVKKIKTEAKKSKGDKALDSFEALLKKAGEPGKPAPEPPH